MKTFTIIASGKTQADVEYAVEEALAGIRKGCVMGLDSNNDGNFEYDSEGEYEGRDDESIPEKQN